MKRFVILMIIAILTAGMVSAQGIVDQRPNPNPQGRTEQRPNFHPEGRGDHRPNPNPQGKLEQRPRDNDQRSQMPITISGVLKLQKGFVAIQNDAPNAPNSGSALYLVPMLNRYIGFINGLREDARVTIEGHQFRNVIHPVKLTIGERTYDFPAFNPNHNFGNFQNKQHGNFRQHKDHHRPNPKNENHRRNHNRN